MRTLFFTAIFVLMGAGDVAWWRWADRRVGRLRGGRFWRGALAVFSAFMLAYLAAALVFPAATRRSRGPVPLPIHAAAFVWHLLVLPAWLLGLASFQLGRLFWRGFARKGKPQEGSELVEGNRLSRRDALSAAAAAVPPLMLAGATAAAIAQLGDVRVRRLQISLAQLPPALDGMTIAHVSDLHVGKYTRDGSLRKLAEQVNGLRCDFVAVTGDLIDLAIADLDRSLAMIRLLDPRNGLLICEGNHDLIEDGREFEKRMSVSGLKFLLESEKTLSLRGEWVQFLGIRWAHGDAELAASVRRVKPLVRSDAFPVLLAHHPHAFDAAAAAGFPLTLSGHTHGGQIMLNERLGFGPAMFRYWSGLYQKGGSSLVVSNGAGNWFPLRINAPADVVHLTIRRGNS